jgi:NAD(P)-dependent dehydrogenase (short-subunit alcohol dehydrogenase family)
MLRQKVAIVTRSISGIGLGTATELAGADVMLSRCGNGWTAQ